MSGVHRLPYIVIRYHYDQVRDEGVNVGVIVQSENGLRSSIVDDWVALQRAYPFIDVEELKRRVGSLKRLITQDRIRVFDYDKKEAVELSTKDPGLLGSLRRELNHGIEVTEPRYAELADVSETQLNTLLGYLYQSLVEPPKLVSQPSVEEAYAEPRTRRAHATLHRAATKKIISAAKKLKRENAFEEQPLATGRTRVWKFDLKVRPAARFLHHILVLPDLEETIHETAALARIWQDVKSKHPANGLTAVYCSHNGYRHQSLRDGERLLSRDKIETIYQDQLPGYCKELLGQRRLSI